LLHAPYSPEYEHPPNWPDVSVWLLAMPLLVHSDPATDVPSLLRHTASVRVLVAFAEQLELQPLQAPYSGLYEQLLKTPLVSEVAG